MPCRCTHRIGNWSWASCSSSLSCSCAVASWASGPAFALASDSRMALLSLNGICKNFAGLEVLRDVQLTVEPGERRAIIGPNGAGKTTLFNIVSGELKPSSGTIALEGQPVTGLAPEKMFRLGLARTFQ